MSRVSRFSSKGFTSAKRPATCVLWLLHAVSKPVLPTRADRCKNGEHDASAELLHGYKTHRSFRPRLLKPILFLCFPPSIERLNLNPLVAGRPTQLLNVCVVGFAWSLHWPDTDRSLVGNRQIIADVVVVEKALRPEEGGPSPAGEEKFTGSTNCNRSMRGNSEASKEKHRLSDLYCGSRNLQVPLRGASASADNAFIRNTMEAVGAHLAEVDCPFCPVYPVLFLISGLCESVVCSFDCFRVARFP